MVKLGCIRHADILKRAYLCQVSDIGSPEPLVSRELTFVIIFQFKLIVLAEFNFHDLKYIMYVFSILVKMPLITIVKNYL